MIRNIQEYLDVKKTNAHKLSQRIGLTHQAIARWKVSTSEVLVDYDPETDVINEIYLKRVAYRGVA